MREQFESGDTRQFTFVSSVAPDSAPIFKVTGVAGTVVASITAQQSSSTAFYSLYTMPSSEGVYLGEWFAQKTIVGSTYDFSRKFLFNVALTKRIL